MASLGASGLVSAWSASAIPSTLRANSTTMCWKPPLSPAPRLVSPRPSNRESRPGRLGSPGNLKDRKEIIHPTLEHSIQRAHSVECWVGTGAGQPTLGATGPRECRCSLHTPAMPAQCLAEAFSPRWKVGAEPRVFGGVGGGWVSDAPEWVCSSGSPEYPPVLLIAIAIPLNQLTGSEKFDECQLICLDEHAHAL